MNVKSKLLAQGPAAGNRDYSKSSQGQFGGPLREQQNGVQASNQRLGFSTLQTQNGRNKDGISPLSPSGTVVLEGYRNDMANGFIGSKPRLNPMNASRPQSSILLNINDPIQIHLLVETALGDSNEFEIISPEEVDELKKQCQSLSQRIEQTQQNLAIQSKYRDAAVSMAKLYNSSDRKDARKYNGVLHRKTDSVKEADVERMRSEERCEVLASELWSLEKRLMEPQLRLLKHTAGILQMTHKGPKKMPEGLTPQQGGVPGSPESMYTYHNARNSMETTGEDLFDDRHLYQDADTFGELLRGTRDSLMPPPPVPAKDYEKEQLQLIVKTEQKLEYLNTRLREVILKANPAREKTSPMPPNAGRQNKSTVAGELLQSHLEYLESSIAEVDLEQSQLKRREDEATRELGEISQKLQNSVRTQEEFDKRQEESDAAMEETIEDMNHDIRDILLPHDPNRPEIPRSTGKGLQDQLFYFRDSVGALEDQLSRRATSNQGINHNDEHMETVLTGLWDIIQSGYEEIRKQKQERRVTRSANGHTADDDDLSADEDVNSHEPFSLQAFSTKVQWLYSQATKLKDQKKVLQIQIKQQRELNNKSDATKDAELRLKSEELEEVKTLLAKTETDADHVREQLGEVMQRLDESRQQELLREQARSGGESEAVRTAQDELDRRNATIAKLEKELLVLDTYKATILKLEEEVSVVEAQQATIHKLEDELLVTETQKARINKLEEELSVIETQKAVISRLEADLLDFHDSKSKISILEDEVLVVEAQKATIEQLEGKLHELDRYEITIRQLEEQIQDLNDDHSIGDAELQVKLSASESKISELSKELASATTISVAAERSLKVQEAALGEKEKEIEEMSMELARLQTEVTIARAELDGAYGSRAQRAAEVAANPVIQREIDTLTRNNISLAAEIDALKAQTTTTAQGAIDYDERMKILKKELAETIEEYELMTKASIDWERERERLEENIDKLRDERESLEAQLSDEKVRWLGMNSPGGEQAHTPTSNTSTTVLKNEFKKMMRDTRAESAKALRAEQAERRRLEDELRALKKLQGPGKSGLSQSLSSP